MKDFTYNYIWDEIIVESIEILNKSISDEERKKYRISVKSLKTLKKRVLIDYNKIRNHLKNNYYDASNSDVNDKNRIDRHKIAACLCYSLIVNKAFSFDVFDGMPKELFTVNYELAYIVSLKFVFCSLIARYEMIGREDYSHKLLKQGKMIVPGTSVGHDEYHDGRIHTLALNDIYGNTFDVLSYADMLFWIEYYNRQHIEGTLTPISLESKSLGQ